MLMILIQTLAALFISLPASAFETVTPDRKTIHHSFVFAYNPKGPLITSFKTTFVVPPLPTTNNQQSIALWPGLLNEDSSIVLQPVLQMGKWANGSTNTWQLATWVVVLPQKAKQGQFISSPKVPVEPGTTVTAVIELVSQTNGIYTYKGYFEGYPATEKLYVMDEKFNSLFLEYEMQEPKKCSDYAREVVFYNTQVYAGSKKLNLKWGGKIDDPLKCGLKIKQNNINGGGNVRIGL